MAFRATVRGFRACGAFLCFAKEESKQRRRRPWSTPLLRRVPCATRFGQGGGCGTRRYAAQTVPPFFRPNLRCSASHKGARKGVTERPAATLFQTLFRVSSFGARRFLPSRRQRRATEGLAEIGRGLSEARSRVPQRPPRPSSAGNPAQQGADAGSPFFAYFLWRSKECGARRETPPSHERKTQIPWSVPGLPCPGLPCLPTPGLPNSFYGDGMTTSRILSYGALGLPWPSPPSPSTSTSRVSMPTSPAWSSPCSVPSCSAPACSMPASTRGWAGWPIACRAAPCWRSPAAFRPRLRRSANPPAQGPGGGCSARWP